MPTYLRDGLYGVALSCFTQEGKLDEKAFHEELLHCLRTRIEGLVLCGSTGEFLYLDEAAYRRVLSIAAQAAGGSKTLLAGVCAPTEHGVLRHMEIAAELGYSYVLICPPYYYPQGEQQVLEFYQYVCRRAPLDMGVVLYHIPFCTAAISLRILPALMELENIVGMKDSSGDMLYFTKANAIIKKARPEAGLFTGQDAMLLPAAASGGNGCMSSAAWLLDELERSILSALEERRLEEARARQGELVEILTHLDEIPFPENYRALAQARGLDCGAAQRQFSALQGEKLTAWKQALEKLMARYA